MEVHLTSGVEWVWSTSVEIMQNFSITLASGQINKYHFLLLL